MPRPVTSPCTASARAKAAAVTSGVAAQTGNGSVREVTRRAVQALPSPARPFALTQRLPLTQVLHQIILAGPPRKGGRWLFQSKPGSNCRPRAGSGSGRRLDTQPSVRSSELRTVKPGPTRCRGPTSVKMGNRHGHAPPCSAQPGNSHGFHRGRGFASLRSDRLQPLPASALTGWLLARYLVDFGRRPPYASFVPGRTGAGREARLQ